MKKNLALLTPILLSLAFVLAACASPTSAATTVLPTLATLATALPTQTNPPLEPTATAAIATLTPLPSPTENPVHSLGQLVKLDGLSLVMIGVDYTQSQLQVTFAAKNTGSDIINVSFIDFTAHAADGTSLRTDACFTAVTNSPPDYSIPSFGGSLQPGENLRGTICWKSTDPKGSPLVAQTGILVSFTPQETVKSAGTWDVSTPGQADTPAALAVSDFATPPHKQGESVTLKDVTVTFDGVTFQGEGQDKTRVVMAHFTLENKGVNSYKFGNFLSYSFSIKLADGSPLGTDFMTVGCQNTNPDVEILPAKKSSFTLCFVDPSASALAPGSLAIFFPNPDEGNKVFWVYEPQS